MGITTPPCGFLRGLQRAEPAPAHHSAPIIWLERLTPPLQTGRKSQMKLPFSKRPRLPAGSLTLRTLHPPLIHPSIKCLTSREEVITSLIVLCLDPIWIRWRGSCNPTWHINTVAGTNGRSKTYCTLQLHDCVSIKCNTSLNQAYYSNAEDSDTSCKVLLLFFSSVCAEICSTKKISQLALRMKVCPNNKQTQHCCLFCVVL